MCRICYGRGRKGVPSNLLSDDIRIVACLDLEGAIVGPYVDGDTNAGDTSFVDLLRSAIVPSIASMYPLTISAASVPPIANSRSAYFFQ